MIVRLLRREITGIDFKGIFKSVYYKLPDMTYGDFLIYQDRKPKYYINILDKKYLEIREYVERNKISADSLLRRVCKFSSEKELDIEPKSKWLGLKGGEEEYEDYEIEEFPISIWDEVKDKL